MFCVVRRAYRQLRSKREREKEGKRDRTRVRTNTFLAKLSNIRNGIRILIKYGKIRKNNIIK